MLILGTGEDDTTNLNFYIVYDESESRAGGRILTADALSALSKLFDDFKVTTNDERKYTLDPVKMRNKLCKSEDEGGMMLPVEVFDIFFASFKQKSGFVSYS